MNGLIAQLLCYFIGIAFSTGGGNLPGQQSNIFVYLKFFLILGPILVFGWRCFYRPMAVTGVLIDTLRRNAALCLYVLVCFVMLFFAVNRAYSLIRLGGTLFQMLSLFCLIAQYRLADRDMIARSVRAISVASLALPLYVLVTRGLSFGNFRFDLQSLNLVHPNILASFYALLLIWHGMHWLDQPRDPGKAVFPVLFAILELLLFSRTAILAVLLVLSLLPFLKLVFDKSRRALLGCVLVVFTAMMGFVTIAGDLIPYERVVGLLTRHDTVSSLMTLTNRTSLWTTLLDHLDWKVFFLGYGYSLISEDYGVDMGTGILYGAHNAWLSVLLGNGIFALVCVLWYLTGNLGKIVSIHSRLPVPVFYAGLCLYALFLIVCFSSEEIGVSLSINFSLLIFLTNLIGLSAERKAA